MRRLTPIAVVTLAFAAGTGVYFWAIDRDLSVGATIAVAGVLFATVAIVLAGLVRGLD